MGCRWRLHPAQAKISWRIFYNRLKGRESPLADQATADSKRQVTVLLWTPPPRSPRRRGGGVHSHSTFSSANVHSSATHGGPGGNLSGIAAARKGAWPRPAPVRSGALRSETPALKQYGLLQKLQSLYLIQAACSCFTGQGLQKCFCYWRYASRGVEIGLCGGGIRILREGGGRTCQAIWSLKSERYVAFWKALVLRLNADSTSRGGGCCICRHHGCKSSFSSGAYLRASPLRGGRLCRLCNDGRFNCWRYLSTRRRR